MNTTTRPITLGFRQLAEVGKAMSGASYGTEIAEAVTCPVLFQAEPGDLYFSERQTLEAAKARRRVNACVVAMVVGSMQLASSDENSRPIDFGPDTALRSVQRAARSTEEVAADFYEPVDYVWNRTAFRMRGAARRYSEVTHADY